MFINYKNMSIVQISQPRHIIMKIFKYLLQWKLHGPLKPRTAAETIS